jgi:hypothetical protein
MPFASTMGMGNCEATPDVCKTPTPAGPVPIPYPNMASLAMANPATCAETVFIVNKPAATMQTIITLSEGDEAGSAGGVISGTVSGPCQYKLGSAVVMIEGSEAVFMGSLVGHNGEGSDNMPMGAQISPSQTVVNVAP